MSTKTKSVDLAGLTRGEECGREVCALSEAIQGGVRTKDGSSSAREGDDDSTIRVNGSGYYGTLSVQIERESIAQDIRGGFYLL